MTQGRCYDRKHRNPVGLKTIEAQEAFARVDTICWVSHVAMLSVARYRQILSDHLSFSAVFPGVSFDNPKITHAIGDQGGQFETTKREMLEPRNQDLFTAWQIVLAFTGMTSIVEYYLKTVAKSLTGRTCEAMGILYRFKDETGIAVTEFSDYTRLRYFCEVRNISLHNLGRINERFRRKTGEQHHKNGPHVFYPQQVAEYKDLIESFFAFVESRLKSEEKQNGTNADQQ